VNVAGRTLTVDDFRVLLEDVLDKSGLTVTDATTAADVEDWDSLNNVRILLALEEEYGVDLPVDELEGLRNVGELVGLVNRLLAG
jgi:acyl carrier protein